MTPTRRYPPLLIKRCEHPLACEKVKHLVEVPQQRWTLTRQSLQMDEQDLMWWRMYHEKLHTDSGYVIYKSNLFGSFLTWQLSSWYKTYPKVCE